MKTLVAVLIALVSTVSMAQGLIFSTITERPKVLVLEKRSPWSGEGYFVHVEENPRSEVRVAFVGDQLLRLNARLFETNSFRIYCDGDFSLANDFHGMQFIALNTVSVCIDDNGWVVAHSFGESLSPAEVQRRAAILTHSIRPIPFGGWIYEGTDSFKSEILVPSITQNDDGAGASEQ